MQIKMHRTDETHQSTLENLKRKTRNFKNNTTRPPKPIIRKNFCLRKGNIIERILQIPADAGIKLTKRGIY